MKVLVKPECELTQDHSLWEANCEPYYGCLDQFCILNGCLCQQKSGWADDDTEDILF